MENIKSFVLNHKLSFIILLFGIFYNIISCLYNSEYSYCVFNGFGEMFYGMYILLKVTLFPIICLFVGIYIGKNKKKVK